MLDKLGNAGYGDLQLTGSQAKGWGLQVPGPHPDSEHWTVWVLIVMLTCPSCSLKTSTQSFAKTNIFSEAVTSQI